MEEFVELGILPPEPSQAYSSPAKRSPSQDGCIDDHDSTENKPEAGEEAEKQPQNGPFALDGGKQSPIAKYCRKALEQGHKECIWFVTRHKRVYVARPIHPNADGGRLQIEELRRLCGWWKRYSLFSVTGVKEVSIRFISLDEKSNEVWVVPMDIAYANQIEDLTKRIEHASDEGFERGNCGLDMLGNYECDGGRDCPNTAYDDLNNPYCRLRHLESLLLQRDCHIWTPAMLQSFWRNGVG